MDNKVRNIVTVVEQILKRHGYIETNINNQRLFYRSKTYIRITYIKSWNSIVLESATSYTDVLNNVFEDDDVYSLDNDNVIIEIEQDIVKFYLD